MVSAYILTAIINAPKFKKMRINAIGTVLRNNYSIQKKSPNSPRTESFFRTPAAFWFAFKLDTLEIVLEIGELLLVDAALVCPKKLLRS